MAGPEDYSVTAAQVAKAKTSAKVDPFTALINKLNTDAANVDTTLTNYKAAITPPTRVEQAAAVAPDAAVATQARRDLQQATLALEESKKTITGGGGTGPIEDSQAVKDLQKQLADLKAANAAQTALAQATAAKTQQNAITFLTTTFTNLGLGADMASAVTNLVQQGYTADTIQMIAQDPKSKDPLAIAFQQRFPANAARLNAGLPVLSPAEYLATERSYAQVMQSYGLNANFATNKDIFTKLLTSDVSPTELNGRISTAKQVVDNTDPLVTQQLQTYYGLSQGDMIAHVLDPAVATPIIEKQISAAQIGAAGTRFGTDINKTYAEQLSGLGVTQTQAGQGFQNIAQQLPGTQELASRYAGYTQAGQVGQALQAATFGTAGAVQAEQELQRLKTQEISQFSGSSGAGKGSLMGAEEGVS